jgi:hypothetical protein
MSDERDRFYNEANLIRDLRELGAVDLTKTPRTIVFERRPLRPDDRPRAAPSWGYAPTERE